MNAIRDRHAFVLSAVARFNRAAVTAHRDDVRQGVALACLVTSSNAEAIRLVRKDLRWLTGEDRPRLRRANFDEIPDASHHQPDNNATLGRLWPIVDRLNPRYREAIVRVYVDDVPRDYVADELGMTGEQFGELLRTAIKRLRVLCAAEGITP